MGPEFRPPDPSKEVMNDDVYNPSVRVTKTSRFLELTGSLAISELHVYERPCLKSSSRELK